MSNMKTLQRKIMRGIYYAYFLRLVSLPGVLQGFVMLAVLIALTHFVSIGHVVQNFKVSGVNHIDVFLYNAVRNTELWTLVLIGLFVLLLLSLRVSLLPKHKGDTYSFIRV